MVTVPADIGDDLGSNYDWSLKTVGQEYLNGQPVTINQGKVVGGGTVLNGMVWTRGSSRDYDAWDALNDENNRERRRWQWEDLEPYFQKVRYYLQTIFTVGGRLLMRTVRAERELLHGCRSLDV